MIPEYVQTQAKIELARRHFWDYCKLTAADFYKEDRFFLKDLCNQLEDFYKSDEKVMVIDMPPRHGKSRTASNFAEWVLGINPKEKIMTGSYNEDLSEEFARNVRDTIAMEKAEGILVYSDIFPNTKIKQGDASVKKWSLEGSMQKNYLATSPNGTATGFGCTIMIIDDTIKNIYEAYNEKTLKKIVDWFNNTMLQRTENNFKIIIIMTRWCDSDLAGYVLANYDNVRHASYKAVQEDGTMLCDEILNKEDFATKTKTMNKDIVYANYQQEPIDNKNRLYTSFKTYTKLPLDEHGNPLYIRVKNYTDTADTGADYLCSIDYVEYNKEAYVINVIYTKDGMELTEPAVAKMLYDDKVNIADIESNNGGRGFARNVEAILKNKYNSNKCRIKPFHQSKNKDARIISNSTWVMDHIYFPINWADLWPEYFEAMNRYQKDGKNEHDDAPDATTGIAEKMENTTTFSFD